MSVDYHIISNLYKGSGQAWIYIAFYKWYIKVDHVHVIS